MSALGHSSTGAELQDLLKEAESGPQLLSQAAAVLDVRAVQNRVGRLPYGCEQHFSDDR